MKEELNIAAILRDKPIGTKLWSPAIGKCNLFDTTDYTEPIQVITDNSARFFFENDGRYMKEGDVCLFPSKQMRDWHKFAWKKGDVLVNSRGLKILFDRWANDNYTSFYAKTINLVEDAFLDTNLHTLASEKEAKSFIKCIEEKIGGKLNLETVEIEKQPEFKPFDKVLVRDYLEDKWMPNFFSCYDGTSEYTYGCVAGNSDNVVFSKYCIPYNEETKHLLGTTDEWKGGE